MKVTVLQILTIISILNCHIGITQNNIHSQSVEGFLKKAQYLSRLNLDSSYYYIDLAHQKFSSITDSKTKSDVIYHKSSYLIQQKKFSQATELLKNYLSSNKALSFQSLGHIHANLGAIAYLKEAYDTALLHYLDAVNYYSEVEHKKGLAKAYLQIGVIYEKRQQMEVANHFYDLSIKNTDSSKTHSPGDLASNITFEKKIEMSQKMLSNLSEEDNPKLTSIVHYNMATSFINIEDYKNALKHALLSVQLKESIGFNENLDVTYTIIGKSYLRLKQLDEAFVYLNKAQEYTQKRHLISTIYKLKIEAYKQQNKYQKALQLHENYTAFKDSVNLISENAKIAVLTAKFETEKHEKEILRLAKENDEKTIALIQKDKFWWQIGIGVFLLISFIVWLLVQYFKTIKSSKRIEAEKKQLIQNTQKASITLNNKKVVYLDNLRYIKSERNYLLFHDDTGKIMDRNKLKSILNVLPPNFTRVHRSYIINKNFITASNSHTLTLNASEEIPISRTFKHNLKTT
jgi:DNA-binding LytR/AlgR family response regulator